jgi:glycerophosphoryl diester phosphodiesterase
MIDHRMRGTACNTRAVVAMSVWVLALAMPGSAWAQTAPDVSPAPAPAAGGAHLIGRAVLPADTFADGPPSGAQITGPTNGRKVPFAKQPVQGVSAIIAAGDGAFWVLCDNGYGAKGNSADFLLRMYKVRPTFKTASGGSGTVAIDAFLQLRDPDHKVGFKIVNDTSADRLLTGADFDVESVQRDGSGDLWFGEEFGPFVLHTDSTGKLLDAPFPLAGVKSPQNPTLNPASGEQPNLGASRGFEGMAISPDKSTLYPMLEGSLSTDPDQRRRFIYTFDVTSKSYREPKWSYRMESAGNSIGELTAIDPNRLLVIERDQSEGFLAAFKRIFLVDLRMLDDTGYLIKTPIVDLLNLGDPDNISAPARPGDFGTGNPFKFPFQTIESVINLDGNVLMVVNDNNYPFSTGRNSRLPDDDEFVLIQLDQALPGTTPGSSTTWTRSP